jgi:hippurate hydrolase
MTDLDALFPPKLRERLLELRRDIHRHPELAFQEERTAERLHAELAALKPAHLDVVAGTGIIARIEGEDSNAPTVVVRGDIDALPIQEKTGLPFASQNPGVMHACGHDVHAAWTIGAAHLLAKQPAQGDVLILLQPAEETAQGAPRVLKSGVLENAAAIFGAHVDRRFAVGQVVAQAGPIAAAADEFTIELVGSGAHGARPHEGIDPIVGAGAVITALQTIVSRRLSPGSPAVVTIGKLHAGSAPNVIPDTARLEGTIRSLDRESRDLLYDELLRIAEGTAAAHGLDVRNSVSLGPPPIVNAEEPVGWARQAVEKLLGAEALVPMGYLNLGGEDFAFYLEQMLGCFLRIGAREEGGQPIPAHSSRFFAADESIFIGAAVLAETARIATRSLRRR